MKRSMVLTVAALLVLVTGSVAAQSSVVVNHVTYPWSGQYC